MRNSAAGRFEQAPAFGFKFSDLPFPGESEATGPDELHDAAEFIFIEPGAVSFANIDNHLGTIGKVNPVHELLAVRARPVADFLFQSHFLLQGFGGGIAEQGHLFLALLADLFKGNPLYPDAMAAATFFERGSAHLDRLQGGLAARAMVLPCFCTWSTCCLCAAMGTKLRPHKNHAKTGGTCDGGQA